MINRTSQTIKLKDGRTLGFAEYGDPNGKLLFYLHGWPSSRLRTNIYDKICKSLNIRLISPDRPGYGLSDPKEDRTLLGYCDDLVELADSLNLNKFSVVGVSGGGPYAAACAYAIPQRITKTGIVVGLGPVYIPHILDDMIFINKISWLNYSRFPILAKFASIYRMIVDKYFLDILGRFDMRGGNDSKLMSELKDEWKKLSQETWRKGYKGAMKDILLYTKNWEFNVEDIKSKIYLWYGESDKNINLGTARYYASHIPNSHLKIYSNEGHLISITHAKEIFKELVSE